ncbi:AzlD domain-containing protein [Ramlibacter terrae]|uniref:AzlD domain-containing protein n=1 Tax=Ramlibacter terrae TaxID=2732511 RepID=A0ABX6P189_9BURK|nr:AzlD domain-containing protein [Ramlibacter terrae]
MAVISLACRAFFLLPGEDLPMPRWLRDGLRYAPVAALAAVVAPELVMTQGHLVDTGATRASSARWPGSPSMPWRRSLFETIVCGTGVMLLLRFTLGW